MKLFIRIIASSVLLCIPTYAIAEGTGKTVMVKAFDSRKSDTETCLSSSLASGMILAKCNQNDSAQQFKTQLTDINAAMPTTELAQFDGNEKLCVNASGEFLAQQTGGFVVLPMTNCKFLKGNAHLWVMDNNTMQMKAGGVNDLSVCLAANGKSILNVKCNDTDRLTLWKYQALN